MEYKNSERPKVRLFSEKSMSAFKSDIDQIDWSDVLNCNHANEAFNIFIGKYLKVFNKCFPIVKISRTKFKDKKWLTKGLKISLRHKSRLYKKMLQRPTHVNKLIYNRYKNKITLLMRLAEKNYYTKLLVESKESSGNVWKIYGELLNNGKKRKTN
jgi:hypothetical protein